MTIMTEKVQAAASGSSDALMYEFRAKIDAFTHAALPMDPGAGPDACRRRARQQVEIADDVLAALALGLNGQVSSIPR